MKVLVLTAGLFVLVYGNAVCCWLVATTSDRTAIADRPMHLLFHRAMTDALEAGFPFFEIGGVPTDGLRNFKLNWGAEIMMRPNYHLATKTVHRLFTVARSLRQTMDNLKL